MTETKDMFDPKLVRRSRGRCETRNLRKFTTDHSLPFLYDRCVEDVCERLADVNRNFTNTLFIGAPEILMAIKLKLCPPPMAATDKPLTGEPIEDKLGQIIHLNHSDFHGGCDVIFDGENIPMAAQKFDLVLNLFSLHSVNSAPNTLRECRRVLRPDGLMIASFLGGQTLNELRHVLYASEDQIYGQITPRVAPMIRLDQGGALLQHCGYTMPVIDRDLVRIRYKSLSTLYEDIQQMGTRNRLAQRSQKPVSKRFFNQVEEIYRRDFTGSASSVEGSATGFKASFEIIWLTGWAPHPDQKKPLKPGSAQTSLAHALGVHEQKLKS